MLPTNNSDSKDLTAFKFHVQVGVQTSKMEMLPTNAEMLSWESYNEDISALDDSSSIRSFGLLEQINVTRDTSDYLWYITRCVWFGIWLLNLFPRFASHEELDCLPVQMSIWMFYRSFLFPARRVLRGRVRMGRGYGWRADVLKYHYRE